MQELLTPVPHSQAYRRSNAVGTVYACSKFPYVWRIILFVMSLCLALSRRSRLKQLDWRKAYIADTWFSEGGFVLGGRSGKDLSWYKSLRRPLW